MKNDERGSCSVFGRQGVRGESDDRKTENLSGEKKRGREKMREMSLIEENRNVQIEKAGDLFNKLIL